MLCSPKIIIFIARPGYPAGRFRMWGGDADIELGKSDGSSGRDGFRSTGNSE